MKHIVKVFFWLALVAVCPGLCASCAGSSPQPSIGGAIDKVLVLKSQRSMQLLNKGLAVKTYKVALGGAPTGTKTCQGDGKTPEGTYLLDWRNPLSKFHLSLHVSYPAQADRARAQKAGCPPGGDIMIHGLPDKWKTVGVLHRLIDWTDGCIAVTNEEMDEIWKMVPDGTVIEIKP